MSRTIRTLAMLAALLCAPAAFAQQATEAQVDRLLEVMRARQTVDAMLPQVQASQQQMLGQLTAGEELDEAERQRLDAIVAASNRQIGEALSWERLEPIYREIYQQTFSAEDVDAMIAFYGSPAGQKLLDKMPQLMQNTMAAVQKMVIPMLQQLEQDIRAETGTATGAPAASDDGE